MSEVFLTLDQQTQQQVAVKIVTNSDSECFQRLQREARVLRKLSHPHILPLLDDGIPSINLPVLPPAHVTLREMEKGFAAVLPASSWQNRVGKSIQRGILGIAALLLLALPVSLGFIVAYAGSQANQPMVISRAFCE